MKTGFSEAELRRIQRGKEILRHLIKTQPKNQQQLLSELNARGFDVKQSTFSNWLSPKFLNVRPKPEFLEPLVAICCPERSAAQQAEILDELNLLLGYEAGPLTPELLHNSVAEQLDEAPSLSLNQQQAALADHLEALDALLDVIEPRILDFGRLDPMIRLESDERQLARQLLGPEKTRYRDYEVETGFEIPLTHIRSHTAMTRIIDDLNAGTRLMQRYLDRHLNVPDGLDRLDFYRIEDFIAYSWEISDRLLHHNQVVKAVPALKRALLRQMTICFGLRFVLQNLTGESSEIAFQNVLALKTRAFALDIHCSVAVYMGILARQLMRSGESRRMQRARQLYRKAVEWIEKHHASLSTEQEVFHYKKELANLHYDLANFALPHQQQLTDFQVFFERAMAEAARLYGEVLETDNLFLQGLSAQRRTHLEIFFAIARCWSRPDAGAEAGLEALSTPPALDENFWTREIARAIGYAVLSRRQPGKRARKHREQALKALNQARLVTGYAERTAQEIASEYVLQELVKDA